MIAQALVVEQLEQCRQFLSEGNWFTECLFLHYFTMAPSQDGVDRGWRLTLKIFSMTFPLKFSMHITAYCLSFPHSSFTSFLLEPAPLHLWADFMMEQKCQSSLWPSVGQHPQSALACWADFQSITYCTWIMMEAFLLSAHSTLYNFLLLLLFIFFGRQHWNFKLYLSNVNLVALRTTFLTFRWDFTHSCGWVH